MKSIIDNSVSDNYHIFVTVDDDDKSMQQDFNYEQAVIKGGESKNKIHAINRDLNMTAGWDILVNMSDDMVFTRKGFDNTIRWSFTRDHQIDLDLCLHFPDGNRNDLITMAIMGKDYFERFGYIYHPDYKSLFCDNEMTEVAKILDCYKYNDEKILEHRHPAYGKAHMDLQYIKTEAFYREDEITYHNRKKNNFNL